MNEWINVRDGLPAWGEEVLVEVNGHRNPSWRNNYNVVAYRSTGGRFYEERHPSDTPLPVIYWMPLPKPPKDKE